MKTSIGQKIRKIRVSKELTQENLAYELGITKSAYSKIERDETNISINRLKEIAKVLEIEMIDFFRDSEEKLESNKKQYGFATKGDIEEIVKMIQVLSNELNVIKGSLSTKTKSKNQTT